MQLQMVVQKVLIKDDGLEYAESLCDAVKQHSGIRIGVSPRGCVALIKAAKAYALLQQRQFVTPDDIIIMASPVLSHRLLSVKDMTFDKAFFQKIAIMVPAPSTGQQGTKKQVNSDLALV